MVNVEDSTVIEFSNEQIERLQHEIAEEHGFDLVDHSLVLYVRKKTSGYYRYNQKEPQLRLFLYLFIPTDTL